MNILLDSEEFKLIKNKNKIYNVHDIEIIIDNDDNLKNVNLF